MEGKDFKTIGITAPGPLPSAEVEAKEIELYLLSGSLDLFHIRKPDSSIWYTRELLRHISEDLHERLILHSHYDLHFEFKLGGIHEKSGVNLPSDVKRLTRGCHSVKECLEGKPSIYYYSFLSPVFDSISKPGYLSGINLSNSELERLLHNYSIVALGGVTPIDFKYLHGLKFAGAALLGYLWCSDLKLENKIQKLKTEKNKINNHIS